MKVVIVGRGKVGTALARALDKKISVRLIGSRGKLDAVEQGELVILAVSDGALPALVARLARLELGRAAVAHVAGALGPEVLAPLRARSLGVAQAHPMLSFASKRRAPKLEGASLVLRGDRIAIARMRRVARLAGFVPRLWPRIDPALYHAAAALAANGLVALSWSASLLFHQAGAPRNALGHLLAPLLRSVSDNVETLGPTCALTGPIRRGDAATVERHLAAIRRAAPGVESLYRELARIQVEMARDLGEAPIAALEEVSRTLNRGQFSTAKVQKSAPAGRPKKAQITWRITQKKRRNRVARPPFRS